MWKLLLIIILLCIFSLMIGVGDILGDLERSLSLLTASRVPRTFALLLTGASLALAGLIMQALARNRFVDPMIAGSGQSAACGIMFTAIFFPTASIIIKMLFGAVASFLGTVLFLYLAKKTPKSEPYVLPLLGIVYGGVIAALVTAIAWYLDMIQYLHIWLMSGEFSGVMAGRYEILWLTGILMIISWWIADKLTVYQLGHEASISLGLNYKVTQRIGLAIVSIIAGCTVVTIGVLPFVGLVVPAIVARYKGDNVRETIPLVAAGGAILVLGSDLISRLIRYPYEIPTGTVMGVMGAGFFIYILFNRTYRHV